MRRDQWSKSPKTLIEGQDTINDWNHLKHSKWQDIVKNQNHLKHLEWQDAINNQNHLKHSKWWDMIMIEIT